MWQDSNPTANRAVAGAVSNVLWAWDRRQVDSDEAMRSIRRVFAPYWKEFGL